MFRFKVFIVVIIGLSMTWAHICPQIDRPVDEIDSVLNTPLKRQSCNLEPSRVRQSPGMVRTPFHNFPHVPTLTCRAATSIGLGLVGCAADKSTSNVHSAGATTA